jgi:hypothetical protein
MFSRNAAEVLPALRMRREGLPHEEPSAILAGHPGGRSARRQCEGIYSCLCSTGVWALYDTNGSVTVLSGLVYRGTSQRTD